MPAIPGLRESQRLGQGGVGGFQDTSIARSEGENLALLGRTIASASKALQENRKQDTFSRSQWIARSQAEAERAKNRFLSVRKDAPKNDDGSKLEEEYDKYSADIRVKYLDSVPEEFRYESEMAYDTSRLRGSADVLKESEVRRKTSQLYGYQETTNEILNNIKDNPLKSEVFIQQGLDGISVATISGIISSEKLDDNQKGFLKKAATARINGLLEMPENSMDIGFYEEARKALAQAKQLFTPDEYEKIASGIKTSKYTGIERIINRERDAEKVRSEAIKTRQEEEINVGYQQIIENSNDPTKVKAIKQNLIDRFKDGKYSKSAPAFFKAFKQAEDAQDAAMSYEIARDLGSKPSNKQINDMRDRIRYSVANDQIGVEKGEYWLKRLNDFNEANKKDPNHAIKVKSIYSYIKKVHNVSDIEDMTDIQGEKRKSVLESIYRAESLLGRGVSPDNVLSMLKGTYKETYEINEVPGSFYASKYTGKDLDNPAAFVEEEEAIEELYARGLINSTERKKRSKELYRIKQGFEGRKTMKEKGLENFMNDLQSNPIPTQQTQVPFRR